MKVVAIVIGSALGLLLLVGLAQLGASESGEVLVLEILDVEGQPRKTRVWVVDDAGAAWVRGGESSDWVQRLLHNPDVRAERMGKEVPHRAVPVREPAARDRVNALMREKYGFADRFIAVSLGDPDREGTLPIRLDPR